MMDTVMAKEFHTRMIRGTTEKSLVEANQKYTNLELQKLTNYQQISQSRVRNYEKEFLGS